MTNQRRGQYTQDTSAVSRVVKCASPTSRRIKPSIVAVAAIVLSTIGVGQLAQAEPPTARSVVFESSPHEADVPKRFRFESHRFDYQMTKMTGRGWLPRHGEFELTFPSAVKTEFACNNTVHCEYFTPIGQAKQPGVIVLHILGGDFELSRTIARGLARSGVGALFVKMPYYGPRRPPGPAIRMISADLDRTVSGMTQAVLDIRRARAWLAARAEIDPERIGITGISLGGIVATLAASADPEFDRACLILAGGNLEKIIRESDETKEIRQVWEAKQFDLEFVRRQLAQVDPLTYAKRLRDRDVLMFNATKDRVIPRSCTDALWNEIGRPKIVWWPTNHYTAAWYLPTGMTQMVEFFKAPHVKDGAQD